MALPPLPKKPKDPESDKLQRAERKALKSKLTEAEERALKVDHLKKAGRIDELYDFIFGRSKVNPLEEITL